MLRRRIICVCLSVLSPMAAAESPPSGTLHFSCEALTTPVSTIESFPVHEYTPPGMFLLPDPVPGAVENTDISPWAIQLMAGRNDGLLKQLVAKLPGAVIVRAKAPGFKALQLRNYVDEAAARAALQRLKMQYPDAFLLKLDVD